MAYWRMQLHPGDSAQALRHTVESLGAGYIGLDFIEDVGSLFIVEKGALPPNQRNYWAFAHEMDVDDTVLVVTHNLPFALARVSGPYNYIRSPKPEIGVWFRHFRRVEGVRYYGDFVTDAHKWAPVIMVDTISPLRDPEKESFQLIERWLASSQ